MTIPVKAFRSTLKLMIPPFGNAISHVVGYERRGMTHATAGSEYNGDGKETIIVMAN